MHETIKGTLLITLLFIRKKLINNIMKLVRCCFLEFIVFMYQLSVLFGKY